MGRVIATIAAVSSLALAAGCFDPDIRSGLSCSAENGYQCPPGEVCDQPRGICVSGLPADGAVGGDDGSGSISDCWSWEPLHVDSCSLPAPAGALDLATGTYLLDTDTALLLDSQGTSLSVESTLIRGVRVLSVSDLTVGDEAVLRAIGTRPLLIAASGAVIVEGAIDVSSSVAAPGEADESEQIGAGAVSAAECGNSAGQVGDEGQDGNLSGVGAGGGGAGFGEAGAKGGDASEDGTMGGAGGGGGFEVSPIAAIRGGCPGGAGGSAYLGFGSGGKGGSGGGAVELAAQEEIRISGIVHAGGAGGRGGGPAAGGGGAGSGGYLGLDAPRVLLSGSILAANGGGGGGGGGQDPAMDGQSGLPSGLAASGGASGDDVAADSGYGGSGGAAETAAFAGSPGSKSGGGGGGGGVGYVLIRTMSISQQNAVVSPPADRSEN